ncbi:MAG: response regulator transcription factor [Planctomycetota bacterium]|nr:response regulator transcription factor [Planctomycetota bacterium]
MPDAQIKLVYVDDHPPLLSAWDRLVRTQPDMKLVAAVERVADVLPVVRQSAVDVVLVDLSLPGAMELIAEIAGEFPKVKTIVYSGRSPLEWSGESKRAGAAEYIDKGTPPKDVLTIIRRVAGAEGP